MHPVLNQEDKTNTMMTKFLSPGAPLTNFNDGWDGSEGFFGFEILAKRNFFGSVKGARIFWVA